MTCFIYVILGVCVFSLGALFGGFVTRKNAAKASAVLDAAQKAGEDLKNKIN